MGCIKLNKEEEKVLESVKEQSTEIVKLLNRLSLLEFSTNYNIGEIKRVLDYNKLEEKEQYKLIKEELDKILKPLVDIGFTYSVSNSGILFISHLINNEEGVNNMYQNIASYAYTINLPYQYVMGHKVTKKLAMQYIEEIKRDRK